MKWEIDGGLLEVQGCIERALDIIKKEWSFQISETAASKEYTFTHHDLGVIGKLKITMLPKERTELYGHPAYPSDDKWLVKYLLQHTHWHLFSEELKSLVRFYAWEIDNQIKDLSSKELFELAFAGGQLDSEKRKLGLDDLENIKKANNELEEWKKKIHDLRDKELHLVIGLIKDQVRWAELGITEWIDGKPVPTAIQASMGTESGDEKGNEFSQNIFRQKGDGWEVAFNGAERSIVKQLIGLAYIHYLLKNPNMSISVKQLQSSQSDNTFSVTVKREQLTDIDIDINSDKKEYVDDNIFDDEYRKNIKVELERLSEERKEANEIGDVDKIEIIDLEVSNIEEILKTGQGLGRKSRSLDKTDDNARSAVKSAISTAYSHLKKNDPLLVKYLEETITTGFKCEYSPGKRKDINPRWIL